MATIKNLLHAAAAKLYSQKSPSLDAEVILSCVLNKPREYLLAHPDENVSADVADEFAELIRRRAKHEPVAYLVKNKEFYGRDFYVDQRVHIPRPATEDLIDFFREKVSPDFYGTIADIGTGSGCIAVTLALLYPQAGIIATDISSDALQVARQNADKHKVRERIDFRQGDLFAALPNPVDIIVANPPYGWNQGWSDDPEVKYQPKESYDGGAGGLDIIKRLIADAPSRLFFEFDPRQSPAVETQCLRLREKRDAFNASLRPEKIEFSHQIKKDLAGFDRIAYLHL